MRLLNVLIIILIMTVLILPFQVYAANVLQTKFTTVTDFDKVHQALDYVTGVMVSSGGDFWIADRAPNAIAHNWEGGGNTEGIIDMGMKQFDEVTEAPSTGYQTDATAIIGHTYVTSSPGKGRYGKFYIDDIVRPGDRPDLTATVFSIRYTYQPDGSRNLVTSAAVSQPVTSPGVTPPPSTGGYTPGNVLPGGGLYENYRGSPDIGGDVRMNYWHGQTFTTLASHQANSVKLLAYRIGNPGTLIVSLRAVNSSGHPSGADLASGSTSGDTLPLSPSGEWREITFNPPVNLTAGTKYAIVARAPGGGGGNAVKWQTDSTAPDYVGGNRESSGDSGANWQSDYNSDYLFEIWGPSTGSSAGAMTGGGQTIVTPPSAITTTPAAGASAITSPSLSSTLHLSCINKDNLEKNCCCYQGAHTYKFGPYNVSSVNAVFDTGRKLTCVSTVNLQVEKDGVWRTIKQVNATSGSGGSEVAPIKVDVQVNDTISGFRISDDCVCCIDNSEITLYLTGGATSTGSTSGTGTAIPPSAGTGTAVVTGTRLITESRTAMPGDTVLLPVRLENAQGIGSLGCTVKYDPAVIQFVKADKGPVMPPDASFVPNSPQPGIVILAYATSGSVSGSGTAAQLEFKAVGQQGSQSALTLSDITATGSGGGQIGVGSVNGQVTIGQKIKGDGTGDGQVTVLDALMALKMYVKALTENLVLDVNGDGKVTPEDARQILKMAKPK